MKAIYLSALLVLMACGSSDQPTEADSNEEASSEKVAGVVTDLSVEDMPLLLTTPVGKDVAVLWREEFGHLEVQAGEKFALIISEEVGETSRKKAALERGLLETHTFLTEDANTLVYRSAYPDSPDLVFVHFYEVIEVGDRSFVISDMQGGKKFSEADINKMVGSVTAKLGS